MTVTDDPPASDVFQRLDRTARYPYRRSEYVRRFAWLFVQKTLFRFSLPRANYWRAFLLRRFGATLDIEVATRPSTKVLHPWLLTVGAYAAIGDRVYIYNLGPIRIGAHTVISQDAYLCAGTHDYAQADLPLLRPPITIGAGVWVAAGAFIGPDVTVGDNSVVGAFSVVGGDVPRDVVVAGNPARIIKPRPMNKS